MCTCCAGGMAESTGCEGGLGIRGDAQPGCPSVTTFRHNFILGTGLVPAAGPVTWLWGGGLRLGNTGADGSLGKSLLPPPTPVFGRPGVCGGVHVVGVRSLTLEVAAAALALRNAPGLPDRVAVRALATGGMDIGSADVEAELRAMVGDVAAARFSDKLPCSAAAATRLIQVNHSSPASGSASRKRDPNASALFLSSAAA